MADATVTYNNTVYYYVKNIQGKVVAILDSAGTAVVEYSYDAWGNILSTTGSMASTLGQINPLRYRGYVYDTETGLYYLQSRYYDPDVGRFINADAFTSTGQGVLGNNMFAYCGNCPIMYSDPSGNVRNTFLGDNHIFSDKFLMSGGGGGGVTASSRAASAKVIENEIAYVKNTDPQVVLDSENIAFYKGVPVIKADLPEGSGFSCIVIFLDEEIVTNDDYGARTLMHEYGHVKHLTQIGLPSYISTVVLPSSIGAYLSNRGLVSIDYYSLPWEQIAEYLGGVEGRTYESWAGITAIIYWIYTCAVGALN